MILAQIAPFSFEDPETGDKIGLRVSDRYTVFRVNDREFFFDRETGIFDGHSVAYKGPVLVSEKE